MLDDRAVDDKLMRRPLGARGGGLGYERLEDGVLDIKNRCISIEDTPSRRYRGCDILVLEGTMARTMMDEFQCSTLACS